MEIKFSKSAAKALSSMDKRAKERVKDGILGLTTSPPTGDIRRMQGYSDGRYRLRVGNYRVIYRYLKDNIPTILMITDIGAHGSIYK